MGFLDRLFPDVAKPMVEGSRILDIPSGRNVRELGGYETPEGTTVFHRFLRSGSTEYLNRRDLDRLARYGVTHVLDLRSKMESPERTCSFARQRTITWANVELYGFDISDPKLAKAEQADNWLVNSYLTMLANHGAVRRIMEFCAQAPRDACLLFHCAAGMDRTGMTAMLLLGLVGVSREQIIKDYGYSFASIEEVDRAVELGEITDRNPWMTLGERLEAIAAVYDGLLGAYGSVRDYLLDCGVREGDLALLRARLLEG